MQLHSLLCSGGLPLPFPVHAHVAKTRRPEDQHLSPTLHELGEKRMRCGS